MADAGYDSMNLRKKLDEYFYKSIISFNKRNTKDINKIKKQTDYEKNLYKLRINIEKTFLKIVYEKNLKIF